MALSISALRWDKMAVKIGTNFGIFLFVVISQFFDRSVFRTKLVPFSGFRWKKI